MYIFRITLKTEYEYHDFTSEVELCYGISQLRQCLKKHRVEHKQYENFSQKFSIKNLLVYLKHHKSVVYFTSQNYDIKYMVSVEILGNVGNGKKYQSKKNDNITGDNWDYIDCPIQIENILSNNNLLANACNILWLSHAYKNLPNALFVNWDNGNIWATDSNTPYLLGTSYYLIGNDYNYTD